MGNYNCPKCGSKGSLITTWEWNGWDYEVISEKCTVCGYTWKKKAKEKGKLTVCQTIKGHM